MRQAAAGRPMSGPGARAQQPEGPRGVPVERAVRGGEHRAEIGGEVPGVQGVEPGLGLVELLGQVGQRGVRVHGGAGGQDPDGQRKPGTVPEQGGHRLGLGGHALAAEVAGEQVAGLRVAEHVEGQGRGAVGGGQAGEPAAAGDDDGAAGAAGQQGDDLGGVAGVVQEHQQALAGGQAAVERGLRVRVRGDGRRGGAEGFEEAAHRRLRRHRVAGGVESPQVHIQLPVGEVVEVGVGPAQGQPGLADPARAADRGDHHGTARPARPGQQVVQAGQLARPAGEQRRCRR
ncbi:hypothetical protein SPAR_27161 [Streptomyces sparsogenes DSM 40356]|uniref:Uncharacterized protein n=1 Tax=Streptomyces sparsogenes DSM 40356 TaxID=1331668 RepID=A0A1R1SDY2_9ACTN|nr:hypothetical protein SPAR_27161 [Streptomyces sparsogenes DSM 40356]